jgi:hypothetical protein
MTQVTGTQGGTLRKARPFITSLAFVVISVAVLALASPALAQTPTFTDVNVYGGDQLDLNVQFTETGLEPGATVDYELNAVADITFTCFGTNGATGKHVVLRDQPASFQVTQQADPNGSLSATINGYLPELSIPPPSCPGHLQGVSTSVTYRQIALSDLTNGVEVGIVGTITSTDGSCSRPRC